MALVLTKWIADSAVTTSKIAANAVGAAKIRLENDTYLRGRNAADSADVSIVKVDSSNNLMFAAIPYGPSSAPSANYQFANKKYVDDQIAGLPTPMVYKGAFDASASDYAAITNPQAGWFYKISVAGVIGSYDWQIGDNLIINQAVVGHPTATAIDKIDNTEAPDILRTSMLASTQIFVGNSSGVATAVSLSGDVTVSNTGVSSIGSGRVTNAMIEASAGIPYSKLTIADGDLSIAKTSGLSTALSNKVETSVTVNGHALTGNVTVTKSDVSLGNVTNDAQLKAADLDTDGTLAANSDSKIASQKAVVTYVAAQIGAIPAAASARREVLTLTATDITNGYKDLALQAVANSVDVTPAGGPTQIFGVDFTLSVVSSKTRITFAGDLATNAAENDVIQVHYFA
jgi:hypothetical protein